MENQAKVLMRQMGGRRNIGSYPWGLFKKRSDQESDDESHSSHDVASRPEQGAPARSTNGRDDVSAQSDVTPGNTHTRQSVSARQDDAGLAASSDRTVSNVRDIASAASSRLSGIGGGEAQGLSGSAAPTHPSSMGRDQESLTPGWHPGTGNGYMQEEREPEMPNPLPRSGSSSSGRPLRSASGSVSGSGIRRSGSGSPTTSGGWTTPPLVDYPLPESASVDRFSWPRRGSWIKGPKIGSGGFGSIYRCLNSATGESFAVKQVEKDTSGAGIRAVQSLEQLKQEVMTLSRLEHPNIVQYMGTDSDDDYLYIFLEYMACGSIRQVMEKFPTFSEELIRNYTRQIILGLAYLHEQDTVHRDIKGSNILVNPNGRVKLADFGVAKAYNNTVEMTACRGTVWWMAPEAINGQSYNSAVDIWSLGCTVIEMVTRNPPWIDPATSKPPWNQSDQYVAMYQIAHAREPPPIPESLSPAARNFCLLCLNINPAHRPTAQQLLQHEFVRPGNPGPYRQLGPPGRPRAPGPLDARPGSNSLAEAGRSQSERNIPTRTHSPPYSDSPTSPPSPVLWRRPLQSYSLPPPEDTAHSLPGSRGARPGGAASPASYQPAAEGGIFGLPDSPYGASKFDNSEPRSAYEQPHREGALLRPNLLPGSPPQWGVDRDARFEPSPALTAGGVLPSRSAFSISRNSPQGGLSHQRSPRRTPPPSPPRNRPTDYRDSNNPGRTGGGIRERRSMSVSEMPPGGYGNLHGGFQASSDRGMYGSPGLSANGMTWDRRAVSLDPSFGAVDFLDPSGRAIKFPPTSTTASKWPLEPPTVQVPERKPLRWGPGGSALPSPRGTTPSTISPDGPLSGSFSSPSHDGSVTGGALLTTTIAPHGNLFPPNGTWGEASVPEPHRHPPKMSEWEAFNFRRTMDSIGGGGAGSQPSSPVLGSSLSMASSNFLRSTPPRSTTTSPRRQDSAAPYALGGLSGTPSGARAISPRFRRLAPDADTSLQAEQALQSNADRAVRNQTHPRRRSGEGLPQPLEESAIQGEDLLISARRKLHQLKLGNKPMEKRGAFNR